MVPVCVCPGILTVEYIVAVQIGLELTAYNTAKNKEFGHEQIVLLVYS